MEFKKVVAGAFYFAYFHRFALAKALAWPAVAWALIDLASYKMQEGVSAIILQILSVCIHAVFAITIHRILLLGPASVSPWGLTSWTQRETNFVLHGLGLFLIACVAMLLVLLPYIGIVLAMVACFWLAGRFSLVFPGIAVEHNVTFRRSWELTQHHQLFMMLVVIVFPILLGIPAYLLETFVDSTLLSSLLFAVLLVFQIAALSMAYRMITEEAAAQT